MTRAAPRTAPPRGASPGRHPLHLLVTAGPTREPLDDVRFLGNGSTGRMGIEVAEAAREAGHRVTLVLGPTHLEPPRGVRTVRVVTALEMRAAVRSVFPSCDALVMTAAVSDYRPARRRAGKWKKGAARISLPLVRNPDIVAEAGRRKGGRVVVGFAVEAEDAIPRARAKVARKRLDALFLCGPAAFAARAADYTLLVPGAPPVPFPRVSKTRLARHVVRWVEAAAARGADAPRGGGKPPPYPAAP